MVGQDRVLRRPLKAAPQLASGTESPTQATGLPHQITSNVSYGNRDQADRSFQKKVVSQNPPCGHIA